MKICNTCQTEKPLDEFNKNVKRKDGLSGKCKSCNKEYLKEHYKSNAKRYAKKREQYRDKQRKIFYEYMSTKRCMSCGISDIRVLEFDHRSDKKFNISDKVGSMNFEKLVEEIEKCDILCANCHRIKTSKQLGWYKDSL